MTPPLDSLPEDRLSVVYDGECPFCSAYVRMARLRESVGEVDLVDARTRPDIVAEMRGRGLEINDGMFVQFQGQGYFGGDAMHVLAMLSSSQAGLNRLTGAALSQRWLARALYPALRTGRNLALVLLGRAKIT